MHLWSVKEQSNKIWYITISNRYKESIINILALKMDNKIKLQQIKFQGNFFYNIFFHKIFLKKKTCF